MILPIYAYGHPILRRVADDIEQSQLADLQQLIADMWDTMYHTRGMGLAAPQVGKAIRLFVVDTLQLEKDGDNEPTTEFLKSVFINPEIIEETGKEWSYDEGCLSIPGVRGKVARPAKVHIKYFDENWQAQEKVFDGMTARVIQHEYDHLEGILFTDHLGLLKKQLIGTRLRQIQRGEYGAKYKMVFA